MLFSEVLKPGTLVRWPPFSLSHAEFFFFFNKWLSKDRLWEMMLDLEGWFCGQKSECITATKKLYKQKK